MSPHDCSIRDCGREPEMWLYVDSEHGTGYHTYRLCGHHSHIRGFARVAVPGKDGKQRETRRSRLRSLLHPRHWRVRV